MRIYNSQLKIWIELYTNRDPAQPPILQLVKRPYLQIVLPSSLTRHKANFKRSFSEIKSYGYSKSINDKLIITIPGARKINDVINLIAKKRDYQLKKNTAVIMQLRWFARTQMSQTTRNPPSPKSKNLAQFEFTEDSNLKQRASATSVHSTGKLKRKECNTEEVFKHVADRNIIDIEVFNGICYRLLLNQQTPKVSTVHDSSGKRLGVISRAIRNFRSLHDYYRANNYNSPSQADLVKAHIGRILAAAFCEEENDLHGGNIGFDPDELLSYKIDHDQATWPFTAKYRNIDPSKVIANKKHRAYGVKPVDAFPITQRDLNNFPYLTDAKPRNFSDKTDSAILDLKGIAKNEAFIYDAFSILLKRVLITEETYRNIANLTISSEKLRERLAEHKAKRTELLKSALIANDKFAKFLLTHSNLKEQLFAELRKYNEDYNPTSPLRVDLAPLDEEFDRIVKESQTRYFAKIDPRLTAIFTKSYKPATDFDQTLVFNCKEKRIKTLKQIMTELRVSRAVAERLFTRAYDLWLNKPENHPKIDQIRAAEAKLEAIVQDLCALDGKVGWVGGETIKIGKNKEIRIANGAAAIFKHYQDYKRGIQPSALKALDKIIVQSYHSHKYQGHWFFNRRHEDVNAFYQKTMGSKPAVWKPIAEHDHNCCC